ncbi:putative nucleotidyltransferase with HDIG domain [Natranaerovirga hydrolytica]|uniref:Putative nucleotidyltransferase with HDIG domain n=1 Tax=Natranaerovirga hydrolytica TaxID=680378 RepID=A0A4R1N042_9FIRM|nr:HDIG domain-containing metalloprotein [Natranaerovirga hydrolytica]TCK98250.1 putative nucleotidyltransferase with HDIG domain [Natranaerovirga hydrolytica]
MKKRQEKKTINLFQGNILQISLAIITLLITVGSIIAYILGNEYDTNGIIGTVVILILMFFCVYFYCYTQKKELIDSKNTLLLLFFTYVVIFIPFILISNVSYYLMPIVIGAMLIALLLDIQLAIIINGFYAIMASLLTLEFNWEVLVFYLVYGTIAALIINQTKLRRNIVWVALTLMGVNALLILSISLINNVSVFEVDILYGVLNAGFSVIITLGSLPLWEALFDVVTPLKLLELSNSNQKLMQRLLIEAPGTLHHSQLVANLSETATTDIGGDYLLARAGALYHDIGKLKNPNMFKENQSGENPHDDFEPEKSARIIIDHVEYGVKLAKDFKLPKNIRNIIQQHQGTTLVKYFYYKAKENNPQELVKEEDYRYSGPIPQTNEAAVVMLADSVEAAVRCIPQNEKNLEKIEEVIQKIIKMKLDEGQLDKSELKIKELTTISNAFLKVYKGMYHERIDYPKEA